MKKRFLFLIVFLVIIFISSFVIAFSNKSYTQKIVLYDEPPKDTVVEFGTDNGAIEVTDYHFEGDKLCLKVEPVKRGSDFLEITVNYPEGGIYERFFEYYVGWFDSVFYIDNLDFTGSGAVVLMIVIGTIALFAVMLWSFIEKWRKAQFSYSMIAYGGAAFFIFWMLFDLFFIGAVQGDTFGEFITQYSYSGLEFIMLITPLVLIFSVALIISNIFLMIREGFRPVNALGIVFSALMIGGRVLIYFVFWSFSGSADELRVFNAMLMFTVTLLSYFESMLFSTVICAYFASRHKPPYDRDYLVILGCAIRRDGSLTPLLRGRVDRAIEFEKSQFDSTGRHAIFVPSGGQGSDEVISEGEAMRRYLIEQGVPEDLILAETKSTNTEENLTFSKSVIESSRKDTDYKVGFATTNYHIFRGYILSQKAGMDAEGIAAKTKWYFFPNAFLREFVGLVFEKKVANIIVALLMVLFFILMNASIPI